MVGVNGLMTATVAWNLITSYYSWTGLADPKTNSGDGLMTANSPWSGHYTIDPPLFAAAHTTQFAAVGSMMLANNSGSGFLSSGGSYVTYLDQRPVAAAAPNRLSLREGATTPFSLVIEKMDPAKAGCGPHPLRTPRHLGASLQG